MAPGRLWSICRGKVAPGRLLCRCVVTVYIWENIESSKFIVLKTDDDAWRGTGEKFPYEPSQGAWKILLAERATCHRCPHVVKFLAPGCLRPPLRTNRLPRSEMVLKPLYTLPPVICTETIRLSGGPGHTERQELMSCP